MSPSFASVPLTSADVQRPHDHAANLSKQSTTPADVDLLSPYSVYQPYNNSDSPSSFTSPAELTSNGDYSDFTDFNNTEDQYFGVDFDARDADPVLLNDIELPTTELPVEAYLPHSNREATLSTGTLTNSIYPPSPNYSTTSNTSHHRNEPYENNPLTQPFYTDQSQDTNSTFPQGYESGTLQVAPNLGGGSYNSFEEATPIDMTHISHSPRVTITAWGGHVQQEVKSEQRLGSFGEHLSPTYQERQGHGSPDYRGPKPPAAESSNIHSTGYVPDQDQRPLLDTEEPSGRFGLDPEGRKDIAEVEIPSLKEQKEKEQLEATKNLVEEWRSRASEGSDTDEGSEQLQLHSTLAVPSVKGRMRSRSTSAVPGRDPHMMLPRTSTKDPDEGRRIDLVSDEESVHENQLQDGQTYFNLKAERFNDVDRDIAMQSRHWFDAPMHPYAVTTQSQPPTAKDAMRRWNEMADNYSLLSRTATWGTRRRSEPSIADYESITDGSAFKRMAVNKVKEKRPGPTAYFKDSFEQVSSILRKKSDGSKLKRNRSEREANSRGRTDAPRKESQTSLAPPPRSPSFNRMRPASPRLDTNVGSSFVHSSGHIRNGSVSATITTSPKNSLNSFMGSIRRSRSKSDIQGLAKMWGESGGPPVPTLAQQSHLSEPEPAPENDNIKLENSDLDAEEDDEEELVDGDEKMDFDLTAIPFAPTFPGFQEHVKRLNPKMEATYLVDRIAHQQVVRYKNLLGWCVKHQGAILNRNCSSDTQCMALGGTATLFSSSGLPRDTLNATGGLGLDLSDGDSNPEGALGPESFPQGVPMPPASTLPAEFECQLCFRVKKFQKPSDWTKHVHEDVQPFTCTYATCREPKSFKRKADWVRHENERHRHLEWWTCKVDDCTHKCYRKDNFLQHLVREHKLPEPKAKTKAAVKKARGGPDEPVWTMVRDCHHETTNKPQDEPCKFCGKQLTSWKKLTVHLAKHMEHISLPVLELVKKQAVDANTIISPVGPPPVHQAPLPVTPTNADNRRPSNSSAVPYGNIHATMSPGGHSIGNFSSPFNQTSPNLQTIHQYPHALYRDDLNFNQTAPNQHIPFTTASQSHHGMMYDHSPVGFNRFDPMGPSTNLNPQTGGYSSMNHSPLVSQTQGFNSVNHQNYTTPVQQDYHSHPSSHHTLSPDPTGFVSGPQHMPGFEGQTLGPDMSYTTAPQQIPSYTTHQNQMLDMGDEYNYQPGNNNQDYSQMRMDLGNGNQVPYPPQQGQMGRGGYGGYDQ